MSNIRGDRSLEDPRKPGVGGAILLIRVVERLALWALLAAVFLAVIAWSFISAVLGAAAGGRR